MRSPTPRQWTGIVLGAVALPALTATSWPLFAFLRGLFPDGLPVGRILLGVVLVVVLGVAVMLIHMEAGQWTPFKLWWLILVAWAMAIGAVAAMVLLMWLVLGSPGLDLPTELSPRSLDAIATRAFAVVAGLGGVALLVIHYRRQRTTEADAERAERAAEREVAKLFTESFDSASEKLGSEHAAVRLAGVHALARLADEAPEDREDLVQMVIDVLCAYLRMPYEPAPEPLPKNASKTRRVEHTERELKYASFREVRHTIIRIIGNRLREDTRWCGKDYDFTGVIFDSGDFAGGDFSDARFIGGKVSFLGAVFCCGIFGFTNAEFTGGEISFGSAEFRGQAVSFSRARFAGSQVNFSHSRFLDGRVLFYEAEFVKGRVSFDSAQFVGAEVRFGGARITGATVSFTRAKLQKGAIEFVSEAGYGAARGACPVGLRDAICAGESGVVILPELWQEDVDQIGERGDPGISAGERP